ncbi:MAG: hypothetical protein WC107_00790 [Patescibacteria group bacterium]
MGNRFESKFGDGFIPPQFETQVKEVDGEENKITRGILPLEKNNPCFLLQQELEAMSDPVLELQNEIDAEIAKKDEIIAGIELDKALNHTPTQAQIDSLNLAIHNIALMQTGLADFIASQKRSRERDSLYLRPNSPNQPEEKPGEIIN